MIKNRRMWRIVTLTLMILGGLLMFLVPPIWIGAIPLALGILIEVIGIKLERGDT